jgi:hypothetical protein
MARSRPRLCIVASCTDRKTALVSEELQLRTVGPGSVPNRAAEWCRRLVESPVPSKRAIDLYAGGHWAVVRSLPGLATAQGWDAKLWVMSAGYGLVAGEAPIRPYSATFSRGHDDSVGRTESDRREWWKCLSMYSIAVPRHHRTFATLMSGDRQAIYLVLGSASYLVAAEADLVRGAQALEGGGRLLVVSSRSGLEATTLAPYCVPSEAPLRSVVGGALTSLHARVASRIIRESRQHGFNLATLRARYGDLVEKLHVVGSPAGVRQSDSEVRARIRTALARGSPSSTALLRALRSRGLACEAKRFRLLYLEERQRKAVHAT